MVVPALLKSAVGLRVFSNCGLACTISPIFSSTEAYGSAFSLACSIGVLGISANGPSTSATVSRCSISTGAVSVFSAVQVSASSAPLAFRPRACWNAASALRMLLPLAPSISPGEKWARSSRTCARNALSLASSASAAAATTGAASAAAAAAGAAPSTGAAVPGATGNMASGSPGWEVGAPGIVAAPAMPSAVVASAVVTVAGAGAGAAAGSSAASVEEENVHAAKAAGNSATARVRVMRWLRVRVMVVTWRRSDAISWQAGWWWRECDEFFHAAVQKASALSHSKAPQGAWAASRPDGNATLTRRLLFSRARMPVTMSSNQCPKPTAKY